MENDKYKHYIGHRQRLKQKLLDGSLETFADYELLEMLLFTSIARRDVKPIAKNLLAKFGDLTNVINSEQNTLLMIEGVNSNVFINFSIVRELINRILRQKVVNHNVISSWSALLDYLKFNMSSLKVERFRILFLNKKNILIKDEVLSIGTIDQIAIYPREVIKRALLYEAGAIILVHNHPSGAVKPSKADIDLTKKIVEICDSVNISVHDHVIIANNEYFSFKSEMLL
jgi:DNA repair protein RadC